jgi:hypothetical protein
MRTYICSYYSPMQRLPTVVAQDGDGALVAVSVQQLLLPAIIAEQNL